MADQFRSQHNIEGYLNHFFHEPGYFLELGCWHGEIISQTAWLERERKWQGLCVDPFPVGFEKRSCLIAPYAISKDGGPRLFIRVSIDRRDGGDVSYFSGFKDAIIYHWAIISEFCDYEEIELETITIQDLYRIYALPSYIDFLSVDVEGSELEIIESIDLELYRFGMIVFEHNGQSKRKNKIGRLLMKHNYFMLKSLPVDDIYINRDLV